MRSASVANVSIALALMLQPFALAAQTTPTTPPSSAALALYIVPPAWSEVIDPLTIDDEDFARHRDPKEWTGLSVRRLVFTDGEINWSVWRIVNEQHRDGPLWVLPHDNENATFGAALIALRRYGGIAMAIDDRAGRMNYDATSGASVDPNRHFYDAIPLYAERMLADLGTPPRLIVALHTNSPGFAQGISLCPIAGLSGSGDISIRLCTTRYIPHPSLGKGWPFDDEDTLALVPYAAGADWRAAFCVRPMMAADFNLITEQVATSDGSLSNYALGHRLTYINFETRERGSDPAGLADAQGRLVAMIDRTMALCGPPQVPSSALPVAHATLPPANAQAATPAGRSLR
ncbi:MAG: hypothetical protein JWR77_2476 [Rhizorhabdus sp.]|nr:hypothetical protein [Rhizorhabdus sp.]